MDSLQHSAWPWLQANGWLWVERISWVVAILGIPSLLIGLLAMVRRPKLVVGLAPLHETSRLFRRAIELPQYEIKGLPATMFNISFAILNVGRATARDLLVNYVFTNLDHGQVTVGQGAPQIRQHPSTGRPMWILKEGRIHPGDVTYHALTLHPPAGLASIDIEYHVSMADAGSLYGSLKVELVAHN